MHVGLVFTSAVSGWKSEKVSMTQHLCLEQDNSDQTGLESRNHNVTADRP